MAGFFPNHFSPFFCVLLVLLLLTLLPSLPLSLFDHPSTPLPIPLIVLKSPEKVYCSHMLRPA